MSLNFKYTNINSSTKVLLTREQIDFVLIPVQITLQQPEEVVQPSDTGPIFGNDIINEINPQNFSGEFIVTSSARPDREILDNIPFIKETDSINIVFTGEYGGRTGAGSMTVRQLTDSILRDFQNRMNPEAAGAVGPFLPQDGTMDSMLQTEQLMNNSELINNNIADTLINNINIASVANAESIISTSMVDIVQPQQYNVQAINTKFIKVR